MSATSLDAPTTTPLARGTSRHRLAHLAPPALALAMSLAFSWRPSLWRDETASVSAATRPWQALVRMLGNVDAVHGLYYALLHPVVSISVAEWWLRLPSALAVAGTAALLVVLGRQLADLRTGVVAATLWALLPISSRYGQEARSTALGVMVTVAATVVLVEALRRAAVVWWVAYGALLALGGYLFLFSTLLVAGHAVVVLIGRRNTRGAVLGFCAAVLGAAVAVVPLLLVSRTELAGQLSWATYPPAGRDLPTWAWSLWFANRRLGVLLWTLIVIGAIVATRVRTVRALTLVATGLAVAASSPVLLFILSRVRPVFAYRYVAGGAAFVCLLAAYGLTRVRGRVGFALVGAVLLLVAGLALPQWRADRASTGHNEDVRAAAAVIASGKRPGDAIVWQPTLLRTDAAAYPDDFDGLDDVALAVSPNDSGTLTGVDTPTSILTGRLANVRRIWVMRLSRPLDAANPVQRAVEAEGFRVTRSWTSAQTTLELLTR